MFDKWIWKRHRLSGELRRIDNGFTVGAPYSILFADNRIPNLYSIVLYWSKRAYPDSKRTVILYKKGCECDGCY